MRVLASNDHISVRAIAGTKVVLFGINIPDDNADGLLGFKIEKKWGDDWHLLNDGRTFKDSRVSLVQAFMWSDYSVDVGETYEYRFAAAYGDIDNPELTDSIHIEIKTEDPDNGVDGIFFNRGVAGSQAYSRKFGEYRKWYKTDPEEQDPDKIYFKQYLKPEDVPNNEAYAWLSRGLEEGLLGFINKAKDSSYSIRASLYELSHKPAAEAFVDALERGVDVKIIHHAKTEPRYDVKTNYYAKTTVTYYKEKEADPDHIVGEKTIDNKEVSDVYRVPDEISETAMKTLGTRGITDSKYLEAFKTIFLPRTKPSISHNKFIILLKDNVPIEVWTGSTNLTYGGIYGQSNVGQIIRNEAIAKAYFGYWTQLSVDPANTDIKNWLRDNNPNLKLSAEAEEGDFPKDFVGAIFSPRKDSGMMEWYAEKMKEAKNSVFLTSAFSIDKRFAEVMNLDSTNAETHSFLRYLLVESPTAPYIKKYLPEIQKCNQNRVAWGDKLDNRPGVEQDDELVESLTGLNSHVNYLHTKYMIIDPLTDDPILISGSANFSEASTTSNDENMLIIRGDIRAADIYVTEFMRLFNHFHIRNEINELTDDEYEKSLDLDPTSAWRDKYFTEGTQSYHERLLFSKEGNLA